MLITLEDDSKITYDPVKNVLYDVDGQAMVVQIKDEHKPEPVLNLRIVLGKSCNFKCVYCMQDGQRYESVSRTDLGVKELCQEIIRVADGRSLGAVSLWGGEPLVYFDKIIEFYDCLKPYFAESNNGNMCITTNGSLLGDDYIFAWFMERLDDWFFSLSYDGRGQAFRGIDVLDPSTNSGRNLAHLISEHPERVSFSTVLSRLNPSIEDFFQATSQRLGFDCRNIGYEVDYTLVNNNESLSTAMTPDCLDDALRKNYQALLSGNIKPWASLDTHSMHFIERLNQNGWDGSCHAAADGTMSLEMNGSLITCQNVNSDGYDNKSGEPYLLANIRDLPKGSKAPLPELRSMKKRWETVCTDCPVKYVCYGGCPVVNEDLLEENCRYFMTKHLTSLMWAVTVIMNQPIKEIYCNDSLQTNQQRHYFL